ncbi:MAG: zinc-binding dehydrogenase [Candidatus Promineifilaceae bacterium]
MRQVWLAQKGKAMAFDLREAADPIPGNGEVRIRIAASGVSFGDFGERTGRGGRMGSGPFLAGHEVAGTVDMVAQGVTDLHEGDEVLAVVPSGGYSDLVCVNCRQVVKRLDWMGPVDSAALPVDYLMAYLMLIVMGALRKDDHVLIREVDSSTGLAILDICKIIGAKTLGTAPVEKHGLLMERGLDQPIDETKQDLSKAVSQMTGGRGMEIVLDSTGGRKWRQDYGTLAKSGRLIHYGPLRPRADDWRTRLGLLLTGFPPAAYTPSQLRRDGKGVSGVNLEQLWTMPDKTQLWLDRLIGWYDEALFRPCIDRTFPLERAEDAHRHVLGQQGLGKVLLLPRSITQALPKRSEATS